MPPVPRLCTAKDRPVEEILCADRRRVIGERTHGGLRAVRTTLVQARGVQIHGPICYIVRWCAARGAVRRDNQRFWS